VAISEEVGRNWTKGWDCCCPAGADHPASGPVTSLTGRCLAWTLVADCPVKKVEVVVMVVVELVWVDPCGMKTTNQYIHK